MPKDDANKFLRARRSHEVHVVGFRVACGKFVGLSDIDRNEWERPGTALLPARIPWAPGMFAALTRGTSMEPNIPDGSWAFFHPMSAGSRQHRIVLVNDRTAGENDRYTLKKYESEKEYFIDGTWQHTGIRLLALNGEHQPIGLDKNRNYEMLGWFVGVARKIARIEEIDFPEIVQEQPAWD